MRNEFAQVGDRVILGLGGMGGGYWCGACEYCLQGQPRFCKENKPIIGTFAEYFPVYARVAGEDPRQHRGPRSPARVRWPHRVRRGEEAAQRTVCCRVVPIAIIGAAGGLGHYAMQIATAFGYQVVGVDIGEERLDFVNRSARTRP